MNTVNELHEALARVVFADRKFPRGLDRYHSNRPPSNARTQAASLTLIRGEKPFTAAYDGQMALDADELQYEHGYGPCVDAGRAGQIFLVDDMRTEQRWPNYAQRVAAHGVLGSLSVPLPFRARPSAHSTPTPAVPQAFGEHDLVLAEEVAACVAIAVGNAEAAARTSDDLNLLRTTMMSRTFIDEAKGILMERHKVNEDGAFTTLIHPSQRTNTKHRDVAAGLVQTGTLPLDIDDCPPEKLPGQESSSRQRCHNYPPIKTP